MKAGLMSMHEAFEDMRDFIKGDSGEDLTAQRHVFMAGGLSLINILANIKAKYPDGPTDELAAEVAVVFKEISAHFDVPMPEGLS